MKRNSALLPLALTLVLGSCQTKDSPWEVQFANNSLDGWHYFQDDGTKKGWVVEDSVLIFTGTSDLEAGTGDASLISDKTYTDFEIEFDWKIVPGGNSGFMWGVQEDAKYNYPYQTGPEIQILDPGIYDDPGTALGGEVEMDNAREDLDAHKHFTGALYDMSPPSRTDVALPAGQWNTYHIKVDHRANHGEVILNGVLINSFPLEGPEWDNMLKGAKFSRSEDPDSEYLGDARWYDFARFQTGHLCFQDHPGMVWFRNIRIRELK